jgi:microcystin-dependent protein
MSNPFVAEVRMFPFTFAPKGWAFCNGQLLPISQNTALFALLGTVYGGDGKSTFALPDVGGSVVLGPGRSTTGTNYYLGQQSGVPYVTLIQTEMPVHTHFIQGGNGPSDLNDPDTDRVLSKSTGALDFKTSPAFNVQMAPQMIAPAGGSLPHNNLMPTLVLNFCIALQGVFPARP